MVTKDIEMWKPVVGFEGRYEVSDLGRIKGLLAHPQHPKKYPGNHILRTASDKLGRPHIVLGKRPNRITRMIHILVMEAFVGPCPEGMEIDHLDSDPRNARLDNLEYVTHEENVRRAIENGRYELPNRFNHFWLNKERVEQIRKLISEGRSVLSISRQVPVHYSTLIKIARGTHYLLRD